MIGSPGLPGEKGTKGSQGIKGDRGLEGPPGVGAFMPEGFSLNATKVSTKYYLK